MTAMQIFGNQKAGKRCMRTMDSYECLGGACHVLKFDSIWNYYQFTIRGIIGWCLGLALPHQFLEYRRNADSVSFEWLLKWWKNWNSIESWNAWFHNSFVTRMGGCISDNVLHQRRDLQQYIRARACCRGDRHGEWQCLQDDVQMIFVSVGELQVY